MRIGDVVRFKGKIGRIAKFIGGAPLVEFNDGSTPVRTSEANLELVHERPIQREFGIGRLSRDVDPTEEALAVLEAQEINARVTRESPYAYTPRHKCVICGAPADMMASFGPACQDHYDEMSD